MLPRGCFSCEVKHRSRCSHRSPAARHLAPHPADTSAVHGSGTEQFTSLVMTPATTDHGIITGTSHPLGQTAICPTKNLLEKERKPKRIGNSDMYTVWFFLSFFLPPTLPPLPPPRLSGLTEFCPTSNCGCATSLHYDNRSSG